MEWSSPRLQAPRPTMRYGPSHVSARMMVPHVPWHADVLGLSAGPEEQTHSGQSDWRTQNDVPLSRIHGAAMENVIGPPSITASKLFHGPQTPESDTLRVNTDVSTFISRCDGRRLRSNPDTWSCVCLPGSVLGVPIDSFVYAVHCPCEVMPDSPEAKNCARLPLQGVSYRAKPWHRGSASQRAAATVGQ